jgi:hypothetical protein
MKQSDKNDNEGLKLTGLLEEWLVKAVMNKG